MAPDMETKTRWGMTKRGRVTFEVEGATSQEAFDQVVADAKELKAAREQLARFDGTDPEDMQNEIDELAILVEQCRAVHNKREEMWQCASQQWEAEIVSRNARIARDNAVIEMQNRALRSWKDSEMRTTIERHGGDPTLVMDYASKYSRVMQTATGFQFAIVDEDNDIMVGEQTREWMSFDQFVEHTLMVQFPSAFQEPA